MTVYEDIQEEVTEEQKEFIHYFDDWITHQFNGFLEEYLYA